jgi:hypothetical protein
MWPSERLSPWELLSDRGGVMSAPGLPKPILNSSRPQSETGTPGWLLHGPVTSSFTGPAKTGSRWTLSGRFMWPPISEQMPGSKPTIKQKLAAIRMLYDFLVIRQLVPVNPTASVRGPKYVVKRGKTPVWSREDAKKLLESIPRGGCGRAARSRPDLYHAL